MATRYYGCSDCGHVFFLKNTVLRRALREGKAECPKCGREITEQGTRQKPDAVIAEHPARDAVDAVRQGGDPAAAVDALLA